MKTANLAIVFTDIKGYTARTSQQTHEENQRMLRIHDALLTPVFKAFGGRLIKTIGDAFLVVFESPTKAVLCGVAIQDRLWDYNRRVAEPDQIHVRVAVNMGEVRVEKGDIFGEPVNIAARVEGVADAGEVLFTEAVYLAMNKAEVPSEDRGTHELKGIPEKVRVYRVPRGDYRLAANAAAGDGQGPPYGGIALNKLQDLPAPEPDKLVAASELVTNLGLAAAQATGLVAGLGRGLMGRGRKAVLGVIVLAALAAGGWALFGGGPIERAIRSGDFNLARHEIKKLKAAPERDYWEGRIAEERRDFGAAAVQYEDAARGGESRGFKRLLAMTEAPTCGARAAAAHALERLGNRDAIGALEDLADEEWEDEQRKEGAGGFLGALGLGCDSRRAARAALESLRPREE